MKLPLAEFRVIYLGKDYYADLLTEASLESNFFRWYLSLTNPDIYPSQKTLNRIQHKASLPSIIPPTKPLIETLPMAVPPPPSAVIYATESKGYAVNKNHPALKTFSQELSEMLNKSKEEEAQLMADIQAVKKLAREIRHTRSEISRTNESINSLQKNVAIYYPGRAIERQGGTAVRRGGFGELRLEERTHHYAW